MYRTALFALAVFVSLPFGARDDTASASTAADSVTFAYDILEPKMAYPEIEAAGTAVYFKVYYVETACGDRTYGFEQKENALVVSHHVSDTGACSSDEDQIYGVEGNIANLPPGKYVLKFLFVKGSYSSLVFEEPVRIEPASAAKPKGAETAESE